MGEQVAAGIYFKGEPSPFRRHSACHDCFAILTYGGVAQLGEHLPCKQGVMSSNLTISTKVMKRMSVAAGQSQASAFMQVSLGLAGRKGIRRIPVMSKMRSICESCGHEK